MYAADLATECQVARGPAVRAVGWLERGYAFSTGPIDTRFVAALRAHATDPGRWLPFAAAGLHACDLGRCEGAAGAQHVVIPSESCVYIAPDLVVHYVEQHAYKPPDEFVDAVLACPGPEQSSAACVDLLLPFAGIWNLDDAAVRRIASRAPEHRKAYAEAEALRAASKGNFNW